MERIVIKIDKHFCLGIENSFLSRYYLFPFSYYSLDLIVHSGIIGLVPVSVHLINVCLVEYMVKLRQCIKWYFNFLNLIFPVTECRISSINLLHRFFYSFSRKIIKIAIKNPLSIKTRGFVKLKIRQRPTLPLPYGAVPSALEGLTSLFGMGRGVSPPL
jgi:hypothetical protein